MHKKERSGGIAATASDAPISGATRSLRNGGFLLLELEFRDLNRLVATGFLPGVAPDGDCLGTLADFRVERLVLILVGVADPIAKCIFLPFKRTIRRLLFRKLCFCGHVLLRK